MIIQNTLLVVASCTWSLLTAHFSASSGFGTVFDNRKAKKRQKKQC
jgi:hypothetical protein